MKLIWMTIVLLVSVGCRTGSSGAGESIVLNNGEEVGRSAFPNIVIINDNCTGTIINNVPQVITAGHCVSIQASSGGPTSSYPRNSPRLAGQITVDIMGERVTAIHNAVHPVFVRKTWEFVAANDISQVIWIEDPNQAFVLSIGADGFYKLTDPSVPNLPVVIAEGLRGSPYIGYRDIAVLTLPESARAILARHNISPASIASAAPAVGDTVTVAGFGFLQQTPDFDEDGVVNDADRCPLTPPELRPTVATEGERSGCSTGEVATILPAGEARDEVGHGTLRFGTNTVAGVETDYSSIVIRGPLTSTNQAGSVTPGPGDSGGPLFNEKKELVGTVMHGAIRSNGTPGERPYHVAGYSNLNAERNRGFLKSVIRTDVQQAIEVLPYSGPTPVFPGKTFRALKSAASSCQTELRFISATKAKWRECPAAINRTERYEVTPGIGDHVVVSFPEVTVDFGGVLTFDLVSYGNDTGLLRRLRSADDDGILVLEAP